jgi:hypothetical protein
MNSIDSDILSPDSKSVFDNLFRKNIFTVVLFVILANGYSNIPGMNEILTNIFKSHILRIIITFILFFQIIDNVKASIIWTLVICTMLYIVEYLHYKNNKNNI